MSATIEPATRRELRLAVTPLQRVKVRTSDVGAGDGSWTIEGYAAVFEQETTLWEVPGWARMREEIARDAFDPVLQRLAAGDGLVHLNHGHDMKTAIASTDVRGIGGLELDADFHGLRFFARVDSADPDAQALAAKMDRGIVAQASFAFTIAREEMAESEELEDGTWDTLWRVLEIQELYDVCVAAQGAYPQTEAHIRSLASASLRVPDLGTFGRDALVSGQGRDGRGGALAGDPSGRSLIAPDQVGGENERKLQLARLQAHAGRTVRTLTNRRDHNDG